MGTCGSSSGSGGIRRSGSTSRRKRVGLREASDRSQPSSSDGRALPPRSGGRKAQRTVDYHPPPPPPPPPPPDDPPPLKPDPLELRGDDAMVLPARLDMSDMLWEKRLKSNTP